MELYGLPCRVPEPTPEQAKCTHEQKELVDNGYEDWDGDWQERIEEESHSLFVDIPNTHLMKCSACGYTRRY